MSHIGPHPAQSGEQRYCQHATCRMDTFDELTQMAAAMCRPDLARLAFESLKPDVQVRCRHVPRKGPIFASLAGGVPA